MIPHCVTGTGRSTTKWTAEVLTRAGLTTNHETACSSWTDSYDDDEIWRGSTDGESSWQAAPFSAQMKASGVKVIHLIRHPLDVVASLLANDMLTGTEPWHRFIDRHLGGGLWDFSPADRALTFWIRWNRLVDSDVRWIAPVTTSEVLETFPDLDPDRVAEAVTLPPMNRWSESKRIPTSEFSRDVLSTAMREWGWYSARAL